MGWEHLGSTILLAVCLGCGSAAEFSDSGAVEANAGQTDSGSATVLGSYDYYFNPSTNQTVMTPNSASSQMANHLLMSAGESQQLGQVLTSGLAFTNWSATDFLENDNSLRLPIAGLQNTEATGKHYTGLLARFSVFNPTNVNMNTTPAHATCDTSNCTVDFGDVPNGVTIRRPVFLFDPSATSFRMSIQFEGTLTTTAPTSYVSSIDVPIWPEGVLSGSVNFTGLGFGTTPTVNVGGKKVTYTSANNTLVNIDTSLNSLPVATGFTQITNGATTINGPYIVTTTRGIWNSQSKAADGSQTGTLHLLIWTNAATVPDPTTHCPPTSNFGSLYAENIAYNLSYPASQIGDLVSFISVTGTGLNVYLGYDRSSTTAGLGANDYYYFANNQTITANATNSIVGVDSNKWNYIGGGGACP